MVRIVALLGALGTCTLALAAGPALGATDRILCAGDAAILVPAPLRAPGDRDPLFALDGAVAAGQAGSALQRWAGPRFASPRNAQVLDIFFRTRFQNRPVPRSSP